MSFRLERSGSFGAAGPAIRRRMSKAVQKTALDIEADAKQAAPVDTGNLRNSIQAHRIDDLNAEVAVGAEYGPHVEFGTTDTPAQPYLEPAAERASGPFAAAIAQAFTNIGG